MAKTKKPKVPYLSEEQICDLAFANRDTFPPFSDGWTKHVLHREFEIGYGLRPDFVQIGLFYGRPTIWIHEFKVFANLYSLDQVARYQRIIGEHASELSISIWREQSKLTRVPDVKCSLIATGFDRFVYEIADAMQIWLWRLNLSKDGFEVEEDSHPASVAAGTSKLDEAFLSKLMASGIDGILPEMMVEEANG